MESVSGHGVSVMEWSQCQGMESGNGVSVREWSQCQGMESVSWTEVVSGNGVSVSAWCQCMESVCETRQQDSSLSCSAKVLCAKCNVICVQFYKKL